MHRIFTYISVIFLLSASAIDSGAQVNVHQKQTYVIVGSQEVDKNEIEITKKAFLKPGKIRVNKKGYSVESYNYSMFSLGSKIRETVNDSMFSTKLKNAVKNSNINYRYINLEKLRIRSRNGDIISPDVDTVKVKFLYP